MIVTLLGGLLAWSSAATGQAQAAPLKFDCQVALMTPQRQLTAPTSVTVSFVVADGMLRDIHVVDPGGILYPGANMRIVKKADVIEMEAVPVPSERPGEWSGRAEKKMYRLMLKSGATAEAVSIGIGREANKDNGRVGLVWNATNQPEGLPQPINGTGVGSCAILAPGSSL